MLSERLAGARAGHPGRPPERPARLRSTGAQPHLQAQTRRRLDKLDQPKARAEIGDVSPSCVQRWREHGIKPQQSRAAHGLQQPGPTSSGSTWLCRRALRCSVDSTARTGCCRGPRGAPRGPGYE